MLTAQLEVASVADLVDRVVARFPDRPAAVDETVTLTYRDLAAAADRIAGVLLDHGVRPGDLVALSLSRSVGYLAAMLGVLRAGGAYVPIDPAEPVARTRAALAGLDIHLLLTDGGARYGLGLPQVWVPGAASAVPGAERPRPRGVDGTPSGPSTRRPGGDWPCYVMFTSGTTGVPKAVLVPHRGVTTLAYRPPYAPLAPGAVLLQLAPLHFDASTFEVWGGLCNGATVVVAPRSTLGADELRELIHRYGVSVLHLTAGLFRVLADERPDCFAGLRCLLTGGDVISPSHLRAVARRFPDLRLVACYGPTEGTTFTSVAALAAPPAGPVPLGDPLPGRRLEVLDGSLDPARPDAPGELYVGGVGLALGYLGRPAETADRFVPDPRRHGQRLYRTGDLARRRPDGSLEYLGRLDDQVKIRGVRVEPAEVEAALVAHPDVRDAVVRPRGPAGEAILVGYLAAEPGRRPTDRALREFLRGRLPAALIPSMFLTVDRLPTTVQGKVDRAALDLVAPSVAPPGATLAPPGATLAPPGSQVELVRLTWQDCLQREVALDENFFELGGHSLLALRIAARLEWVLARPVPLRAIFEHPTVRELADWLGDGSTGAIASTVAAGTATAGSDAGQRDRMSADVSAASDDEVAAVLRLLNPGDREMGEEATA